MTGRRVAEAAVPGAFVVLWSSAFVAGSIGLGAAPPLLLTLARFALAGVLLAVVALAARAPWPRGRALGHVVVAGLLLQAVQFGAFYTAMALGVSGAIAALVQGLHPVLTALLAVPLLGERVSARQWAGFALGAAGVTLAVAERVSSAAAAVLLCGAGLLGLSLGTLYQKRFCPRMDLRSGQAVQLLAAVPVIGLLTVTLEHPRVTAWAPFTGAVLWLALVNSIGAFTLLYLLLRRSQASRASSLFFLTPSVTAVMAWALLHQPLSALAVAGLVLSGAGVALATRAPRAEAGSAPVRPPAGVSRERSAA
ncbi:DMT family transporter [Microbispora corallina]|uniref:Peptide ABC transporter ATP-binding protein n=1 Tax=Microbispora corallina TaxID=83302 RepID=A0ABQ4G8X9_9ACTN|nr:DMT family transporter [Microbispora corallina]GIH43541.1 peptide ABC transporter ATP-binding protein [Microbispora corallina]